MRSAGRSFWKGSRDFFRNSWVVSSVTGLVAGLVLMLITAYLSPRDIQKEVGELPRLLHGLRQPLLAVGAIVTALGVIRGGWQLIRRWSLIHFTDSSYWLSIDPLLTLRNRFAGRRFDSSTLVSTLARLASASKPPYYTFNDGPEVAHSVTEKLQGGERPTVVLKIPARPFLSVPDFEDLRLLRLIEEGGGRVIVIVMDVSYRESLRSTRMDEVALRTELWVRRVVGWSARVVRLSRLLGGDSPAFLRFLLDIYVPLYSAKILEKGSGILWTEGGTEAVSFLLFGLRIYALDLCANADEPLVIIQWNQRLASWKEFTELKHHFPAIRIAGFIVARSFVDPEGTKVPTSVPPINLFTMTDSPGVIARKILAGDAVAGECPRWRYPDRYLTEMARTVLGARIEAGRSEGRPSPRVVRFCLEYCDESLSINLEHWDTLCSVRLRYAFFEAFSRIQRGLRTN